MRNITLQTKTSIGFKPAVGYLRRSTDRQEQSIDDQKKAIELYAITAGYELLDFYIDDAISGASSEGRTSFLKLIEDAKRKDCPFQYVLVYDVKRFGRVDNDEAGYYRYQLRKNGVEIIYVSESFNGDDTDDLLRPVKQWQARQELKDLSKVTIRGLLSRSEGGWWMGGSPPYGYDLAYYNSSGDFICVVRFMENGSRNMYDSDGNLTRSIPKGDSLTFAKKDRCRLVLSCTERVEAIKDMFKWYIIEGLGYKSIAAKLNRSCISSPRNGNMGKWANTTIMGILKNPAYAGDMVWNRLSGAKFHKIVDKSIQPIKGIANSRQLPNPEDNWIVCRDAHPAIVSRDRFNQVQAKIKATGKHGYAGSYRCGNGANSPYLLTGMVKCSNCGHNWTGYKTIKGRKRKDGSNPINYYYACNGYVSKGNSVCYRKVIPKDQIESWVLEVIGQMIAEYLTPENMETLKGMVEQEVMSLLPESGSELNRVEHRLNEISKAITNLIDNITDVNREFVDKRIIELKHELIDLERRKQELESVGQKRIETEKLIEQAMSMAGDYQQVFAQGSVEEKRFFIRSFLKKIELDPVSNEGTARFILLPGLDKLWQPVLPSELSARCGKMLPNMAQKNPQVADMSSRLLVAGAGFEPATSGL